MSARLALRIQERLSQLSPSERQLALLLLERQDDLLTYSAAEMARLAGVSKATAARLFRSLGYSDFQDVRLQAREERNRTAPFQSLVAPEPSASAPFSIAVHLAAEQSNLARSLQELSADRLELAVEFIRAASAVWVIGEGPGRPLAGLARAALFPGHANIRLLGSEPDLVAEDLSQTGPGDALIVIALKPWSRPLRAILDYARTSRMSIIAITDIEALPIARRYARVILPAHVGSPGPEPSVTALASLIRLLAAAVTARNSAGAPTRAELIAEIREELEDWG